MHRNVEEDGKDVLAMMSILNKPMQPNWKSAQQIGESDFRTRPPFKAGVGVKRGKTGNIPSPF